MTDSTSTPVQKFFDIHTTGYGYLGRIREVKPKKGFPFLACSIAALSGSRNNPSTRYFDVRVSGREAQGLVRSCIKDVNANKKVLVKFRLGDLWADIFERTKGADAGKTAVSLKGRLLKASVVHISSLTAMSYFELSTRGIGVLNRLYEVQGDTPYLTCSIGAFCGPVDDFEFRNFDLRLADAEAEHLIRRCADAVDSKQKVQVSFRLDDMQADFFTRTKGENAGELVPILKSNLVYVGSIKVDGELEYKAAPKATDESAREDAPAADVNSNAEAAPAAKAKPRAKATPVANAKSSAKDVPTSKTAARDDQASAEELEEFDDLPY